jgi:hypothetical protein
MHTSANAGDTSLADVDSIDTPPRVTPAPSPLLETAAAAATQPRHREGRRHEHEGMDDVFSSQTSSSASVKRADSPGSNNHGGFLMQQSRVLRESSTTSTVTGTASATTCTQSSVIASARTRVPSKEKLYGHRSNSRKGAAHRAPASPHVESRTAASAAVSSNAATTLSALPPPSVALAEQYGKEQKAEGSARVPATVRLTPSLSLSPVPAQPSPEVSERQQHTDSREGDAAISTDALLRCMQNKEREFDEKIHVIHHTFQNAGEQLVIRDTIIAQLQDELAQLRTEASRIPKEYQAREEKLLLRVQEMMRELQEEQTRLESRRHIVEEEVAHLREALHTADQQLAQQQRVSDDLLRQLRTSDKALQEAKVRHAAALQESRQAYEDKLIEFQQAYNAAERELVKSHALHEEAERDRAECQAKLLEHELDVRRHNTTASLRVKELVVENDALREEVEAVQLSMARLLRLMTDVPALADYLQWNELSSEFVFLGYPTRYFANGNGVGGNRTVSPMHRCSPRSSRQTSPARRRRADGGGGGAATSLFSAGDERSGVLDHTGMRRSPTASASPYYQDVTFSGGSAVGTGVDDGVYAGIGASFSKNVWLNGRWAQQMMDIIAAENNFTRLKRIKLLELEEAAQLSEQLPSARDVLEGRRPEQDYWIPYAVFTEAQKFKNKYYPKLPAVSHFYPFLIQLNKIWRAKLQDRLRVRQSDDRQRSVSRHRSSSAAAVVVEPHHFRRCRTRDVVSNSDGDRSSQLAGRSLTASQLEARRSDMLLTQLIQCEDRVKALREEHHRLRRDVRLHVSSQRTLQLFRLYDELIRGAYETLEEVVQLANELYNSNIGDAQPQQQQQATETGSRKDARAAEALRNAQLHAQLTADIAEATDARDRLLCVVERTCERVCGVGDSLATRMLSYYSDLHQLIRILHHRIRQLRTRGSAEAVEECSSSNSTTSENSGDAAVAPRRAEQRNAEEATRRLRGALRKQYGATETVLGGKPDAPSSSPAGSIHVDSLLKLAASVLDFGDEVRKEVTNASAALRTVAEQAMRDAERLHGHP